MATGARAFLGYFARHVRHVRPGADPSSPVVSGTIWVLLVIGYLLLLTALNFRGIKECTRMNVLCTVIEGGVCWW